MTLTDADEQGDHDADRDERDSQRDRPTTLAPTRMRRHGLTPPRSICQRLDGRDMSRRALSAHFLHPIRSGAHLLPDRCPVVWRSAWFCACKRPLK